MFRREGARSTLKVFAFEKQNIVTELLSGLSLVRPQLMGDSADKLSMHISWFPAAILRHAPAIGDPETMTWTDFCGVFLWRREGEKDGPCFVAARFKKEPDGRHVRRLRANVLARTAVALDLEVNKATGEMPPCLNTAMARAAAVGWAALGYTSHSHCGGNIRYRVVVPLSAEVEPDLPTAEVVAEELGLLGVLDMSKVGASSAFYLPSCPCGALVRHQTTVVPGSPIDAGWIRDRAGALLAGRRAEAEQVAAAAHSEAAARRAAKIAAGFDPDDSLIEKLRARLDLSCLLVSHGYARAGTRYRHPNSQSGSFGADIKVFGGIERVFSHNATDPLHADNLPAWCDSVTAIDAFDVVAILEFGGDRDRALRDLAERFGLTKAAEGRILARKIHRLIRRLAKQEEIEAAAFEEGERLGLTEQEVCRVAERVARRLVASKQSA